MWWEKVFSLGIQMLIQTKLLKKNLVVILKIDLVFFQSMNHWKNITMVNYITKLSKESD